MMKIEGTGCGIADILTLLCISGMCLGQISKYEGGLRTFTKNVHDFIVQQ